MCHHELLIYSRCGHSASTLAICYANSRLRSRTCPQGWFGNFEKMDEFCLGCLSTLWLADFSSLDEGLSFIKTLVDRNMPFSYVCYGHLPRSNDDCAERVKIEPMVVIGPHGYSAHDSTELGSLLPTAAWKHQQPYTSIQEETQTENHEQTFSAPKTNSDPSSHRQTVIRTKPKKRVQFTNDTHVQYFWKGVSPVSVSSHSSGMNRYCAIEPVIWN